MKTLKSLAIVVITITLLDISYSLVKIRKDIHIIASPPSNTLNSKTESYIQQQGYTIQKENKDYAVLLNGNIVFHIEQDKDISFLYADTTEERNNLSNFVDSHQLPSFIAFI